MAATGTASSPSAKSIRTITASRSATGWSAPLPPAEPAPEHSEGSEHYQEPEPTLAAWQEDWQPPPTGPVQHETASHDSNQATVLWDEAHADGVGSQGSEPGSIALR